MKPPRVPDCVEMPRFPTRPNNRPSLPHIGYRIGTYSDVRQAILWALDRDVTLAGYTHRQPDDPGIALLEGAAILTDILTFYQELYANEAFLRTASWRESVADLVKLTGYRLAPAIGGRATFSMQVRGDQPVTVPAGFAIKADLQNGKDTASFETVAALTAQPFANSFNLFAPLDLQACAPGTTALRAPGSVTLKPGDKLLVGDGATSAPLFLSTSEIVVVDQVRQYHGETLFTIKGGLRRHDTSDHSSMSLAAFKLGRSFKHFGHNAPSQEVVVQPPSSSGGVSPGVLANDVPFTRSMTDDFSDPTVSPALSAVEFPLDQAVTDLPINGALAFRVEWSDGGNDVGDWCFVRRIVSAAGTSMKWGSLKGASTIVTVDSALDTGGGISEFILGELQMFEVLESFRIAAQRVPTATPSGKVLYFFGQASQLPLLRSTRLAFVAPGADTYTRTVVSVPRFIFLFDAGTPRLWPLTLDDEVDYADFDNDTPTVTVYGNLVDATEGKTQPGVVLGNGDERATFQTFRVPKSPLTYLVQPGATPPQQPEVHVYVGAREWTEVAALYGHGPLDEVYVVRQDANGDSWVQFGDGITGARVPSGVGNVSVVWRAGAGSYGPMKPNTDPQLGARLDALKGVKLPGIVTGGAPAETGDHAREVAPGRLQSLDRLVSLDDFASEALGIGGVVRARADWGLVGGVPGIVVTILMAAGRDGEAQAVRATLAAYNRCRGPHRVPILVRQAAFEYVYLDVTVSLDGRFKQADVLVAIKEALGVNGEEANGVDGTGGLFDLGGRLLGESEYASRVEGVVQDVAGVVWTRVTAFGSLGTASDPTTLVLPREPRPLATTLAAAPDRIFRLYDVAGRDANDNALVITVAASPPGAC